ncbi:MAG: hypothetical protein EU542_00425 [Promethearchaeota archaeon]|nr:MAG: hypothetical protein EU542_00425 [Candidatus Lokiarchaeota archaeon]
MNLSENKERLISVELRDKKYNQSYQKDSTRSLWQIVAKNEIRIRTSKFRNYRIVFFISIYSTLFIWALIFAPILFDVFMPTIELQYSTIFKPLVSLIIESLMMALFLVILMYPLNNVYRETEINFKESMLATPISSRDIFFGEFLGKMPIYLALILIIGPVLVGLINPLIDLNLIQYIAIYFSLFGLVSFANLIGSLLASWLEHKISKNEKARELGKLFIWIFAILLVVIMYAAIFFLNDILNHPELKNWLAFYPSFWYSNIILYSIDPVLLNGFVLNITLSLLLAIFVPLVITYLTYQKVESFYSLEGINERNNTVKINENLFYRLIQTLIGSKWGTLTIIQLKRLFRKKSNFARLAYVFGLLGFMTWFMASMAEDEEGFILFSTMLTVIGGAILSVMIGHLAFLNSKDVIWVYKRSPRGLKSLIYSYLFAMFIISIFLAIFETIFFGILAKINLIDGLIFFGTFLLLSQFSMAQAMGIQCLSPAYGEKDPNMRTNTMISMVIMQPIMILPIIILIFIDPGIFFNPLIMRLIFQAPVFIFIIAISSLLLYFGMRKLKKIE